MKIKDAEYKHCPTCNKGERVSDDEYGCDNCKKPITLGLNEKGAANHLSLTVFHKNGENNDVFQYCSWKCCFEALPKLQTDYFINLPYLMYDEEQIGLRAQDFFDAIKDSRK